MREGKGITPDVPVVLDPEKYKQGIDTQFEAAIKLLIN
jgi:C-terminal processing protease CtpA/Prc